MKDTALLTMVQNAKTVPNFVPTVLSALPSVRFATLEQFFQPITLVSSATRLLPTVLNALIMELATNVLEIISLTMGLVFAISVDSQTQLKIVYFVTIMESVLHALKDMF